MKQCQFIKIIGLWILIFITPAQANEKLSDVEIRSLLKQITVQSILPIYRELDKSANDLVATTQGFCGEPDAVGLKKVRQAWSETLSLWQQSSPLLFGPATEDSIDFTVYFRPVKKAVINGLLAKIKADSKVSIDQKTVDQSGVGGQGLATVEYLLFDRKQTDEAILKTFSNDESGRQRCEYLVAIEALLASNLQTIVKAWESKGGNYSEGFYTAGEGSAHFTKAYQSMELFINRLYQAIQAVEIKKLGVPLGLRGSRTGKPRAYPYKLEAWRSGHSLQNVMSVLRGLERLLIDGGVLQLLEEKGETVLATSLRNQLKALLATKFESEDLFQLLSDSPTEVSSFYEQIRTFADLFGNGFAPAMGVQLGFNQNDGD